MKSKFKIDFLLVHNFKWVENTQIQSIWPIWQYVNQPNLTCLMTISHSNVLVWNDKNKATNGYVDVIISTSRVKSLFSISANDKRK